jgi:O-acetyl-ADP-ribose deacetylase (regulator of RNase III)
MIIFKQGNIFDSNAQVLVNPVNCVGVMGAGLALEFKRRFPDAFVDYRTACRTGALRIGKVLVSPSGVSCPPWVIHFPTKNHFRNPSRLEYIGQGLIDLAQVIEEREFPSVALPALGCGLGGLPREPVFHLVKHYLGKVDAEITLYH